MHSGHTSIRIVSTWASSRCWGRTSVSSPVRVVCVVLTEPAERVTVLVKVTGGQHYSWRNPNTTQEDRQMDIVEVNKGENSNKK